MRAPLAQRNGACATAEAGIIRRPSPLEFDLRRTSLTLLCALVLSQSACVIPRFSQDIAVHFARDNMRKMETPHAEIYYSEQSTAVARRIAGRFEQCVELLRRHPISGTPRSKFQVFITRSNFNNAYVQPAIAGLPQQMVLPEQMGLEFFDLLGIASDEIGDVSCHESMHYVQMQENNGFWRIADLVFGDIFQPNALMDSWFLEGIATFYEGRLDRKTGRPHNPIWRGMYESALAKFSVDSGNLNVQDRRVLPVGGNYLVGQHFVEWLALKYGEEKLWEFIDDQGSSVLSPLWVTLRFKAVYGNSIGAEMDAYAAHLRKTVKLRERTPEQKVLLPEVGYWGRLAVAQDGSYAVWNASRDEVTRITVYEKDGRERFSRKLAQLFPGREWISTNPVSGSGFSFSADGKLLSFAIADVTELGDDITRVFVLDATDGKLVAKGPEGFIGTGGSLSPDGRSFLAVTTRDQQANLIRLDLATGMKERLTDFKGNESLGAATYAPDGQRIAFSRWSGEGFDLYLREADGRIRALTQDHQFNYGARWLDDNHLVFLHNDKFHAQPYVIDVQSGAMEKVIEVPYAALDVGASRDGRVIFLNRDGWSWSLDSAQVSPERLASAEPRPGETFEANTLPTKVKEDPHATILRDEAYRPLEGFFIPTARGLAILPYVTNDDEVSANIVVGLMGSDRLGLHYWALNAGYRLRDPSPAVSLSYGTYLTAPWFTSISGGYAYQDGIRDISGGLGTSRSFWTWPVSASFNVIDRQVDPSGGDPGYHARAIGPSLNVSWSSSESTPYGGTQRGLALDGLASWYPRGLGSSEEIADLRGEADVFLPLPLLKRQNFVLYGVARAVPSDRGGLLRVGGGGPLFGFLSEKDQSVPLPGDLAPGLSFTENLRGYEDRGFAGDWVLKSGARYRYSFIIDEGWASFLYLFPAYFIRQVDVEAFGTLSKVDPDRSSGFWLRSAGGALFYRAAIGNLPVSVMYQYAYRFDQGLGNLHIFGITFD